MESNPFKQPKWALESDDPVVVLLLKAGTPVTRANYIRVAFFGEQGDDLDAELEAGLPEPLRRWDEDEVVPDYLDFVIWSDATRLGGVCLRWDSAASELHWRPALAGSDKYWLGLPSPSRVNWKAFWLLLDQAEVWDWEPEYAAKTSAHAGWSFEASFRGRMVRTSGGGSAYPNDTDMPGSPFDILLTALGVLAGVEISKLRPPNGWGVSRDDDEPPEVDAEDEE